MPDIEVGGRRVHFTDAGSGAPVLLLHAAFSSSAEWRALGEALLARGGLRVLAVDLQGYGGSTPWDPPMPGPQLPASYVPITSVFGTAKQHRSARNINSSHCTTQTREKD